MKGRAIVNLRAKIFCMLILNIQAEKRSWVQEVSAVSFIHFIAPRNQWEGSFEEMSD